MFPFEGLDRTGSGTRGNVRVTLYWEKSNKFSVRGRDLVLYRRVSLKEALLGTILKIKHLDSRIIHLKTPKGIVLSPSDIIF